VCVWVSDLTTASDDPSSSALCVVCIGRFPRGVPGGAGMPPLVYAVAAPQIFLGAVFAIFSDFSIFSGLLN
jgi:hypothetical protein